MASYRPRPTADGQPRYTVTFRQHGKQTSRTVMREKDAKRMRDLINALGPDEALARIYGSTRTGPMPTVTEWLGKHVDDLSGISDRTRADYRSLADRYIVPLLGALDVDEVTTADIGRWANHLEKMPRVEPKQGAKKPGTRPPVSAKTIANLRGLLSAAFGYAVDEGLRGDNPMRRLRRSRAGEHERVDMTCLTPQEFGRLRALMPEHWQPFVTFLAFTGLRFGEAVALEVGDVDLLAPTPVVRVTKSWRRIPGGFEVGPPKSRKSRRTVSLPEEAVDALAPLVARSGDELLFVNGNGNRVLHSNFHQRIWTPAVAAFEAETGKRPRVHDLRHSHVSWLVARGVHMETIRDRVGHESIVTTSTVYSHLLPDQHRATAAALDGLLTAERT